MKRLINTLYADPEADLSAFKDCHVESSLKTLQARLTEALGETYRWLASATRAVEAGRWGGDRRRNRRLKLLAMINTCRVRLGMPPIVMENNRWADVGLYYCYGAVHSYGQDHGMDLNTTLLVSMLDSHGPAAAAQVATALGDIIDGRE